MPPVRRALIVIDVQQEYFQGPLAIGYPPPEESLAKILEAVRVADLVGIPVVIVQHEKPEGAALFAVGSTGWSLHPGLDPVVDSAWKRVVKNYASVFDGTGLADWLHANDVDTITLVGYMANNCVLASAAAAAPLGFAVEVLSDAIGAIHLANEAGSVSAGQLRQTLLVLLQSNFAAVATTQAWAVAAAAATTLPGSSLLASATLGRATQEVTAG